MGEQQRQAARQAVSDYFPVWSEHYARVRRSEGLDSGLNREYRPINRRMDLLLERYFDQLSGVELQLEAAASL